MKRTGGGRRFAGYLYTFLAWSSLVAAIAREAPRTMRAVEGTRTARIAEEVPAVELPETVDVAVDSRRFTKTSQDSRPLSVHLSTRWNLGSVGG
jgi:hypothetical protein